MSNKITRLKQTTPKPRHTTVLIPIQIQIDPANSDYCFSESWENRSGAPGRCPGIETIGDGSYLFCEYFDESYHRTHGLSNSRDSLLYDEYGNPARWKQTGPIRRCTACIIAEDRMKKAAKN